MSRSNPPHSTLISSANLRQKSAFSSVSMYSCQTVLRWTGFTKTSSLILFTFTVGIFSIFSAFQTMSLEEGHPLKADPPGEHFWFGARWMRLAMQAHLYSVIRK
jgi:hypothetical protein